jgi:hypothetical protein
VKIVDGMNPRKGMQRMIRWLKSPVDYNPPTFAKEEGLKEDANEKKAQIQFISKL